MKTAVIVHGHHLGAAGWEHVVWGEPSKGVYGRAAAGLREALRFDASMIIFGTGASSEAGILEAEKTYAIAREKLHELKEFATMPREEALAWLANRARVETIAVDTKTEIEAGALLAIEEQCDTLVLVSSPTHIMRAHKTALSVLGRDEKLRPLLQALYAVASDTPYEGSTVDDVIIIEPPHRPDRPGVFFNETLRRLDSFRRRPDIATDLNDALKGVMDAFEKRL